MAIKIYIDQGHNPQNPNAGAEANGLREQDLTFDIGIRLAELLNANPEFEARVSRPTPTTQLGTSNVTSLQARTDDANDWGADYFISLHANASTITSASGSEAYVFRDSGAAFNLAVQLLDGLVANTGLPNRGVFTRPSLFVLRRTTMPAVLVEMGFITNPGDAALMSQDPQLFAQGMYNGILHYFGMA